MKIAIDASRAFLKQRTGIEEYAYQVIKHLRGKLSDHEVVLYLHPYGKNVDFDLPKNWQTKKITLTHLWTQMGLSWEMMTETYDVLFIPAHTVPMIHPKNTVVTIHGLEYEHSPESYSLYALWFHRNFVRKSCRWAKKIIAVSESTKNDLKRYYKASGKKVEVIHNGYAKAPRGSSKIKNPSNTRYILSLGRVETRKNIIGIARTFDILRKEYDYQGELLLAGKPGYGYQKIKAELNKMDCRHYIRELGFVSDKRKWRLLKEADVFLFPSLSEGFGIPVLEAQNVGVPTITSNIRPFTEIVKDKNVLADPKKPEEMAQVANKIITNNIFRRRVIERGKENAKRFSWNKCAMEVAEVLASFDK